LEMTLVIGAVADQAGSGQGKLGKAARPAEPWRQAGWVMLGGRRGLAIEADSGERLDFGP
jgi:hypothetical protein